ncbi:MAG TPA: cupin domain-containing protein [Candidatus Krumholzibacteria bacterium]|nr:cupin domain-containing protein [Candidatus Krumholzibacteria bacterium]
MSLTADDIKRMLQLEPHPMEGGFFRETYRSRLRMRAANGDDRNASTAIYYLLTPETFSALHRLPGDEIFHFYLGDTVEMLQLWPHGSVRHVLIGSDLARGVQPQVVVPGGVWQGCRVRDGGNYALLGTTMSPGFDMADFEIGERAALVSNYPSARDEIVRLTRP